MELRFLAPINGKQERGRETDHVKEGDYHAPASKRGVKLDDIKARAWLELFRTVSSLESQIAEGEIFHRLAVASIARLGNLTLLAEPLNASVSNKGFDEKRKEYAGSKIGITSDLLKFEIWNLQVIDQRQTEMAAVAPQVWPLQ